MPARSPSDRARSISVWPCDQLRCRRHRSRDLCRQPRRTATTERIIEPRVTIRGTRAARFLQQFRNLPEDICKLTDVLQRIISEIACELPEVQELDINPAGRREGVIAVDARIVVAAPKTSTAHYGHMAIHPYPPELEANWQLPDGTDVSVRPIRPEDAGDRTGFRRTCRPRKALPFAQSMDRLTP